MTYTPFGKNTTAGLTASHLSLLVDVPEGWFIEYKRDPCKPKDYAKEATALANSRGGWIFIGIEEDPQTGTPALRNPGVPTVEATRLLDAARDAIAHHASPSPYLEMKIVNGPIPELSISDDRSVLVIFVPQSYDTPHIHSSGRIYRRNLDAAEPVEITDRTELDELYARKSRLRDFADEHLNLGFDERWAEDIETPWIHVALVPNPTNRVHSTTLGFEKFRDVMRGRTEGSIDLPDIYSSALGYVARNQRRQEVPHGAATTLEYSDGAFYVTIPLSSGPLNNRDLPVFLQGDIGKRFTQLLREKSFSEIRVIDGTFLAVCMFGIDQHISKLIEAANISGSYFSRIRLWNVFRCVPFFDSATYLAWCESDTLPVIHRSACRIPWPSKQWLHVEDIRKDNVLVSSLADLLPAFGVDGNITVKVLEESAHATVRNWGSRGARNDS